MKMGFISKVIPAYILLITALFSTVTLHAKKKNEIRNADGEIIKQGYNFGPLPVVAFDQDKGFQFGGILNIFNFGDGSNYPNPKSSWYIEASAYTKGSQKYIVSYNNKTLIPGVQFCTAGNILVDKAMDFFGYNGYESFYDSSMPSGFYKFNRLNVNFKADFIGKITKNFYWEAGYHFNYFKTDNFTGKNLETTLFQLYKDWGIIDGNSAEGGFSSAVRAGLIYDSRDFEAAPSRGIWAETHLIGAPSFLGTTHPYAKFSITFRHYVPLFKDKLTFAYRINYQAFLGKNTPWYVMPYFTVVGPMYDREAIGGYRTVRGLMMNRVQGLQTGFYNAELRWKFVSFQLFKQNFSFVLSGFCDGATTFAKADNRNMTGASPELYSHYIRKRSNDGLHIAAGAGFRIIMNRNFIVAVEYARCTNPQDGKGAFYMNTGFLF